MSAITSSAERPSTGARRAINRRRLLDSFPLLLGVALLAQLIVLLPVLHTAFWQDDDANAYISGYLRWIGQGWWHFFWTANKLQVNTLGRPMPLGVLQTYGAFLVFHDRIAYKLMLILLTLIASGMIGLVVRRLGASAGIAALAAALPAVCWQLHLLHDALISYTGLVQAVTIYSMGATLLFIAWLRRGGTWRLIAMAVLTAFACLTYEAAYLLPIALVPVAWYERKCSWRRAVVLAWPSLIVAGSLIVVALVLGRNLPATSGYRVDWAPGVVLTAWAKIVTSGLPMIGWLTTGGPRDLPASHSDGPFIRGLLIAALLVPLLLAVARPGATAWLRDRRRVFAVVGIIAALMLTPSLLTAVSGRYQQEVLWGWGYLPMFFAALGWAALGALAIGALLRALARSRAATVAAVTLISIAAGVMTAINAEGSARVVNYMTLVVQSRDLVEAGFSDGVLAQVPTGAAVLWYGPEVALPRGIWVPGAINFEAWAREFVNRPLTMRLILPSAPAAKVCTDATGAPSTCALLQTPTYWLRTASFGSSGFVAIAQVGVRRWNAGDNTLGALTQPGSRPVAFVRTPGIGAQGGGLPFTVTITGARTTARAKRRAYRGRATRVLRRGSGWALVQLPPQPPFVAASISVIVY